MIIYVICLISGLLTALPVMFEKLWLLSWVSMIPFFYILMTQKGKYRYGLAFSLGFYGLIYTWFWSFHPLEFLGLSNVVSILTVIVCWVGMSVLQSSTTSLIAPIFRLIKSKKKWTYPLALASIWTLLEFIQELTWAGVPFCRLAVSQAGRPEMIQSASLFGNIFIGFLIALVNALFALAIIKEKERVNNDGESKKFKFKINICAAIGALIVCINFFSGLITILTYRESSNENPVKVGIVQGDLDNTDMSKDYSVSHICDICCEITEKMLKSNDVDIVLWSECTLNCNMTEDNILFSQISSIAKKYGTTIVFGSVLEEGGKSYNSLFAATPDGKLSSDIYKKQKLVPFGEYVPMRKFFETCLPIILGLAQLSTDLTPGDDSTLINSDFGKLGCLVCFDSIYEEVTRKSVQNGAEILLLSTNDAWFKVSSATRIHKNHAILRAVESGKYVIRSAATGQSCVINPNGVILSSLKMHDAGYLVSDVTMNSNVTFYSKTGNIIVIVAAAIMLSSLVVNIIERKKAK